jgi:hypothetical protein
MADENVIPPGQEELLGTILGKGSALPGDCKLAAGNIEKTIVHATYACPSGEVIVELAHSADASANATRTEKFALRIERGTPPPDLQSALLSRIREHENEFGWITRPHAPLMAQPRTVSVLSGTLVLVPLLLAVWLLRRRGRATPR